MPHTVNIEDPKARLSHLVAQAEEGQDVILERNGIPAARIIPINTPIAAPPAHPRRTRCRPRPPRRSTGASRSGPAIPPSRSYRPTRMPASPAPLFPHTSMSPCPISPVAIAAAPSPSATSLPAGFSLPPRRMRYSPRDGAPDGALPLDRKPASDAIWGPGQAAHGPAAMD